MGVFTLVARQYIDHYFTTINSYEHTWYLQLTFPYTLGAYQHQTEDSDQYNDEVNDRDDFTPGDAIDMEYQPEEYDEYVDDNDIHDDDVNNMYKLIHSDTKETQDLPEDIRDALKPLSKGKHLSDQEYSQKIIVTFEKEVKVFVVCQTSNELFASCFFVFSPVTFGKIGVNEFVPKALRTFSVKRDSW